MTLRVGSITVLQRPTTSVDAPHSRYPGLNPSTTTLPEGHQKTSEHRAFTTKTIFDRDVQMTLRDGVKIRADIFRPDDEGKVPALLAWSPYGKTGAAFFGIEVMPERVGVPQSMLSGYQKFEAPDPAEWVPHGYGVVNVDTRGAFDSEGDLRWVGSADAQDGSDVIEEIAKLPWCNGKVALIGNSWLAMSQWQIAAQKPPHLACVLPLEGASDLYREVLCRGGVPNIPFSGFVATMLFGRNNQEDIVGMFQKYPFMNEYWADKRATIEDIEVPAYILASYSTGLHTVGSFRGFEDMKHDKKWLRVHPTQEWHDLYQQSTNDDLRLFLDHFTKGSENGWEDTPKVRVSMLSFNKDPIVNHVFPDWPIPNTSNTKFFLQTGGQLAAEAGKDDGLLSYQSDVSALQVDDDGEELKFSYTVEKKSHLVGYAKAVLYMSCPDHEDFDVFVQLRKADKNGKLLQNLNIPLADMRLSSADQVTTLNPNVYLGPTGVLRASSRAVSNELSKPHWAVYTHTEETAQKVKPGDVVKLEIGMWPTGIVFEEGEKLVLKVSGHPMTLAEFVPLRGSYQNANRGVHRLHVGAANASHVVVPFVEV